MNRNISNEFFKRVAPLAIVLGLGVTACADNTKTVDERMTSFHTEVVDLCTDQAEDAFTVKYPEVTVSEKPTAAELKKALTAAEGRESNGATYMQTQFDVCMDDNFGQPTQQLIDQQINIAPTSTTEVTVATT